MDRHGGGGGRFGAGRNSAPARAEDIARALLKALAEWQTAQRPPDQPHGEHDEDNQHEEPHHRAIIYRVWKSGGNGRGERI